MAQVTETTYEKVRDKYPDLKKHYLNDENEALGKLCQTLLEAPAVSLVVILISRSLADRIKKLHAVHKAVLTFYYGLSREGLSEHSAQSWEEEATYMFEAATAYHDALDALPIVGAVEQSKAKLEMKHSKKSKKHSKPRGPKKVRFAASIANEIPSQALAASYTFDRQLLEVRKSLLRLSDAARQRAADSMETGKRLVNDDIKYGENNSGREMYMARRRGEGLYRWPFRKSKDSTTSMSEDLFKLA